MGKKSDRDEVVEMGPLWRLPALKSRQLGKTGPAFGVGFGCGVGFAIGLIGGFGPGFPGLHLGYGLGAGCGVGVGFGYGVGRGIAYDGKFHSNLAKLSNHRARDDFPLQNELYDLVDELVVNTQKLMQAASRAIDQRRKK